MPPASLTGMLLIGLLFLAALVLAVAGFRKITEASATSAAFRSAGFPVGVGAIRALGVVEIGVAGWVMVVPGRVPAVVMGALYTGFAIYVWRALQGETSAPCGCFGDLSSPPSRFHLIVDLVAAVVGFGVGLGGDPVPAGTTFDHLTLALAVIAGGFLTIVGMVSARDLRW